LQDNAAGAAAKAALGAVDALNDVTDLLGAAAREAGLMNRKGKLRKCARSGEGSRTRSASPVTC
jgi:hypothetical protein